MTRTSIAIALTFLSAAATPAQPLPPFQIPDTIEVRKADIYSEGTRMSADIFSAKANAGGKLPVIVLAHGWGGTAAGLRREAVAFAQAGYLAVTFDYRGWGPSDSRLVLTAKRAPAERQNHRFTAEVQEVREVVEPLDMVIDWQNAIAWAAGDAQADPERIGLWGSSLSGGLVVSAAIREPRVKAIHSQVGALDGRWIVATPAERAATESETTRRARGESGYPAPRSSTVGKLIGAPTRFQFAAWVPVEEVGRASHCAMQFVIAEKEELFDNKDHAVLAHARAKGPKNLVTIPGITHYGIYTDPSARARSRDLAIEWFDRHVKKAARN